MLKQWSFIGQLSEGQIGFVWSAASANGRLFEKGRIYSETKLEFSNLSKYLMNSIGLFQPF